MDIPFDEKWFPEECAMYLGIDGHTPELESRIRAAILAEQLPAVLREGEHIPAKLPKHVQELADRLGSPSIWEPTKEYRYLVRPIDAIKWAIDSDIQINDQCRDFYASIHAVAKRRKSGPREETLLRVIAGLAKAYGYDPTSGQRKQNKLQEIARHSGVDEKTIRETVKAAISSV